MELRAAVRWALEQLTPDARALVWLHDVEGYTAEELTERFGATRRACASGCTAPADACANYWSEPSGSTYPQFPPNLPSPLSHFARRGGFYECDSRKSEVLRCAHEFGG